MEKIWSKRTVNLLKATVASLLFTTIYNSSMKETINLVLIEPPTVNIYNN